jgi:hypothetical protein
LKIIDERARDLHVIKYKIHRIKNHNNPKTQNGHEVRVIQVAKELAFQNNSRGPRKKENRNQNNKLIA